MALKKLIPGGTQYYYLVINHVGYTKPQPTEGMQHMVYAEMLIKDSADPAYGKIENSLTYPLPVVLGPDPVDPLSKVILSDPLDLNATPATNVVAQAYTWLKANIALFADFTSV